MGFLSRLFASHRQKLDSRNQARTSQTYVIAVKPGLSEGEYASRLASALETFESRNKGAVFTPPKIAVFPDSVLITFRLRMSVPMQSGDASDGVIRLLIENGLEID